MCGIIGVVGLHHAADAILTGLKRLEYRGYDSAGIATIHGNTIHRARARGKIVQLEAQLQASPLAGSTGIGHTRWATHGAPTTNNAHPHATEYVAVVHNGIIENHQELRAELSAEGAVFSSETDTEVAPHLISKFVSQGFTPEQAVTKAVRMFKGAYALGVIFADHPDMLIAARSGSPLAIGYGTKGCFIGSDATALAPFCNEISYLEEGDIAVIQPQEVHIFNQQEQLVKRAKHAITSDSSDISKGDYAHYMLKEIHEQPKVIAHTLQTYYDATTGGFNFQNIAFSLANISQVTMVACGTSYYAAMTARYWMEQIARIPSITDIASEFRYRKPILASGGMALFISQSGETADTLAALRYCRSVGQHTLALVNVEQSSMAMEADGMLRTLAGVEIGVASTKAFTTQLTALACLTLAIAQARKSISDKELAEYTHALGQLSDLIEQTLRLEPLIKTLAKEFADTKDMLFIGRGTSYAIASEGALKMKEISYIHAEGYAAGELKHGPLALVDDGMPIIVVAPEDELFDKTASNLQETVARGGKVILLSSKRGIDELKSLSAATLQMPECHPFIAPILYAIPLQLMAYYTALARGTDVDQPRNLAKSVTVE
jgi:glucosamine--fructose-6-phosphate aminotransferase (isomerizing)